MRKILIGNLLFAGVVFAHTPVMYCFDNGDNTVTCEGGFSDGSSAEGVKFSVEQEGKAVIDGKFPAGSEITFNKPNGEYTAVFDAGKGHFVKVSSTQIAE
eukprot:Anaeramoba_ignava/c20461_g1_i1.p5 GENE.c20461_g1_i1~~c20461_g1_i1.p5  ORF type:complete len:100 (+),score=1.98 c20461_g1_i1:2976-3275(+)